MRRLWPDMLRLSMAAMPGGIITTTPGALWGGAQTPDPSVSEAPAMGEHGGGDQVARWVVRSLGSHQDELAAEGDWCHNLVEAAVLGGV